MQVLNSIEQALFTSFSMLWEILWPLILGFTLSGIVQAVVSHNAMARTLGGDGLKSLTFLIILPILDIYRKYYGWKVMGYIFVTFFVTMAADGYVVEFLFEALGLISH